MNISFFKEQINAYTVYLRQEERSTNTIVKYLRDLATFFRYLGDSEVNKDAVLSWKNALLEHYAPASVNSMLAAVNNFFTWLEMPQLKVKPIKVQRSIYAKPEKELTRTEYDRLVAAAERQDNRQLSLLLQTVCSTGIRISELRFITVEAVRTGRAVVDCKGKSREVFLIQFFICKRNVAKRYVSFNEVGNFLKIKKPLFGVLVESLSPIIIETSGPPVECNPQRQDP